METLSGRWLPEAAFEYDCPRCGDSFVCAGDDDIFAVTTHRLLHQAGAWRRSLWAARFWVEAEGAGALAE